MFEILSLRISSPNVRLLKVLPLYTFSLYKQRRTARRCNVTLFKMQAGLEYFKRKFPAYFKFKYSVRIFSCRPLRNTKQQINSPSLKRNAACDSIFQSLSHVRLRLYRRQYRKINIMLMNCNPEFLSGKYFKRIEYFNELIII